MNTINPVSPRLGTVKVMQGDDEDRLEELKAEVDRLRPPEVRPGESRGQQTLGDDAEYVEARDAYNAFAAEAEARAVVVKLRALGRKTWRELVAKFPPRDGNEGDEAFGANVEDFGEALVPASIASPQFNSNEERDAFLNSLNDAQFELMVLTAYSLNRRLGADPKARLS